MDASRNERFEAVTFPRISIERSGWMYASRCPVWNASTNLPTMSAYDLLERRRSEFATRTSSSYQGTPARWSGMIVGL